MDKKNTSRATNGEGYVGSTLQKVKKKFDNSKMCDTCANCSDRSKCQERTGWIKCDVCKNCKEDCLKYCDRFYCRKIVVAQISVNGKQVTVANEKTRKDAIEKKKKEEANIENAYYILKSDITLYQICQQIEYEKIKLNILSSNTINRHKALFKKIESAPFHTKPIQKVTKEELQDFLASYKHLSQSEIDKLVYALREAYERAVDDGIIAYLRNPMKKLKAPLSEKKEKEVVAFELDEFIALMEHLLSTDRLMYSVRNNIDNRTMRNMLLLSLLSLTRIGELAAIDLDSHIDLKKKRLIVERTLSRDADGRTIIGETTKTGRKNKKKNKRAITFNLFSEELYSLILNDQIEHARNNLNNTENLLFCDKFGNYINSQHVTVAFKRICRQANIKLNLPSGCHIHMTRHTGISLLMCMGFDLMFITIFSGHCSIREIERTYGHFLNDYKQRKLENPDFKYSKEDIITPNILKLARERYNK